VREPQVRDVYAHYPFYAGKMLALHYTVTFFSGIWIHFQTMENGTRWKMTYVQAHHCMDTTWLWCDPNTLEGKMAIRRASEAGAAVGVAP
jgi:hypothetical protein